MSVFSLLTHTYINLHPFQIIKIIFCCVLKIMKTINTISKIVIIRLVTKSTVIVVLIILDALNQVGKTALHYATEFKSWEVATLLLQQSSCDVSIKDAEGMTPLLCASPHLYERKQPMVVETAHPYSSNMSDFWDVSLPGATSVTIVFDSQCVTEKGDDYLQFYTDRSKSQRLGKEKYTGSEGGSNWPGVDGTPPLVIAADNFVAYFYSSDVV